jgi:Fur family transcriptional regulator, ferric uptake regulator
MSISTESLLKQHQLRLTAARVDVVDALNLRGRAVSHAELEYVFIDRYDRVTLYRTLKTFLDVGIIHKILDNGGTRYALCHASCVQHHNHDHVHFKCNTCGETQCIEGVTVPKVELPLGFAVQDINFLAEGTCPKCI